MDEQHRQMRHATVWAIAAAVAFVIVGAVVVLGKMILGDQQPHRQRQIQTVMLMKPPPLPKITEPPPPPEVKKQEIVETEQQEAPDAGDDADDTPPGEQLGLDADGSAGGDAFGLAARKGGRSLIGGNGADPYAWYQNLLAGEIQKVVNKLMQEHGGVPNGNVRALVRIVIDDDGNLVDRELIQSSGVAAMDEAVRAALKTVVVDEPRPIGMPEAMRLEIFATG
jgi:periplasmic protein TonB